MRAHHGVSAQSTASVGIYRLAFAVIYCKFQWQVRYAMIISVFCYLSRRLNSMKLLYGAICVGNLLMLVLIGKLLLWFLFHKIM